MATPHLAQHPNVGELPVEDTDAAKAKAIVVKAGVGLITYPLTFSKTLFQLGFEPYPLSTGKVFLIAGRDAYFLPNALKYIRNVYTDFGLAALYRGAEAGVVGTVLGGFASHYAEKYLDTYYPDVGGRKDNLDKKDDELTNYESFRVHLRYAIRLSISTTVGVAVTHPFTVVMVREIAQHIGGESKYTNVLFSLLRVGDEEGLPGLYSGIVPMLIASFVRTWGIAALGFAANRLLLKAEKEATDQDGRDAVKSLRKYTPLLIPFTVNAFSYPFEVCSTVFAVVGSHLAVSMLPYSPGFHHWSDTYDFLKPTGGLARGARLFLREHKGAVNVGADHSLYASNKYFV
ncbi:Mitochondrial carrier-like protein 2 [Aphelenchoides bicaudatus]|nr:Mitochondrial carrier-like protein 2 [Aphelenchoides bicaudatus]